MIANIEAVRTLAINVKSNTPDDFILLQGRIADSQINGRLAGIFVEWLDLMNNVQPYPDIIVDLANILTAARLEQTKYAVSEASGKQELSMYAKSLKEEAKEMLEGIYNGTIVVLGLTRRTPVESDAPDGTFDPVGGLRTQGGNKSRLDEDMEAPFRIGEDTIAIGGL